MMTTTLNDTRKRKRVQVSGSEILTAEEALEILRGKLGRTTWYRLLKEGQVPARRCGKKYILLRSALLQWLSGDATEVR
jgi:excisionase family DNA binding protein